MNLSNNLFFFFSALGAFNGFVAGIYFLFLSARKSLSNYLLGALLMALSIRISKSVAYFFDYNLSRTILQSGLTACLFIGPLLYFFVKSEMKQIRKSPVSWSRQLMAWSLLIAIVGIAYPYENFPKLWGDYFIPAIYIQWGIYTACTVPLIRQMLMKISRREKLQSFEKWILIICAAVIAIYFAYVWAYTGITRGSYIAGPLCFSLVSYLVIFMLLYRHRASDLPSFKAQKYGQKKLDEGLATQIISNLQKAMKEKELFRNPNLKISDLAREVGVSVHPLSRVLNEQLQKNFTLFVNEYRVEAACKVLSGETNFTIEAVGEELGFNSKSTLFAAFKKIKGLTPSVYTQELTPDL